VSPDAHRSGVDLPDFATRLGARVASYTFDPPLGYEHEQIEVRHTGKVIDGQWRPDADVWAIRKRGWCLNRAQEWEYEPLPSSRDDEFMERCRFTRDDALHRARLALEADNLARRDSR
jgi:hypothetical protein